MKCRRATRVGGRDIVGQDEDDVGRRLHIVRADHGRCGQQGGGRPDRRTAREVHGRGMPRQLTKLRGRRTDDPAILQHDPARAELSLDCTGIGVGEETGCR